VHLVQRVAGLTAWLDERGADLEARTHHRGLGLLVERAQILGLGRSGRISCGGAARFVKARDGWLAVTLARPADVEVVPAWLGCPVGTDPWASVEAVAAGSGVGELRDRAAELGLACSIVGEARHHRPAVVAAPVQSSPGRSIRGATVVNLASLWAGPLAANLMRRMGARVIDVESFTRPDGARSTPELYGLLHEGHEIRRFDFTSREGVAGLRGLLLSADVIIEGSRPRGLEQIGIDAFDIVGQGPRVWLSITAFGRGSGVEHRVGFGDDCAGAAGLCDEGPEGPRFIADAVADPITGLITAASGVQLLAAGGRQVVDIALARCATAMHLG
jgi:hypothetical protein